MIRLSRFLSVEEYNSLNDDAMARGYHRDDRRIFQPGWGWYEPWYWDPVRAARIGATPGMPYAELQELARKAEEDDHFYGYGLLSRFYWETWAAKRPPICVVLPNGVRWEIDRKSSNGEGWTVTGDWPNLNCAPSIAARGYHGFLQNGAFTADCERPGKPDGENPYPATWVRRVQFDSNDPRRIYSDTLQGDPPADYRAPPKPEGGFIHCEKPA